jgi:hypothetical protein
VTIVLVNSFASTANAMMTLMLGPTSVVELVHHHQVAVVALANPPAHYNVTETHTLSTSVLHQLHHPHKHHSRLMISAKVATHVEQ